MPVAAYAESKTVWSFLGGQVGPEWRVQGTATTTAEVGGLRIRPETDTKIFREAALPHSADFIEVTYLSLTDNQAILLWHNPGGPPGGPPGGCRPPPPPPRRGRPRPTRGPGKPPRGGAPGVVPEEDGLV